MNCVLLLKESVAVSHKKSLNKIRCSDEEFLNVEGGYRPTCKHLHLQFEGSVSTPYGGQTVLPFGCFNPGNRTCLYLLDCRQGVPQCLSEFGSEENKNRWISEIVIRILLNKMLNYYSHWVYNLTNALRGTTHDIHQLLHISALRCHLQGVITTKMYMPTCQYVYWQVDMYT